METDAFDNRPRTLELRSRGPMLAGLESVKAARGYMAIIGAAILLSYGSYAVLDSDAISAIGVEDGLFENVTAACFLAASSCFLAGFLRSRSWFLLLMSFVFFLGFGEEISWGQRVFGFQTPEAIAAINVQKEFNLHNIELLNGKRMDKSDKTGVEKLFTVNFLYKLFWLAYGVVLPIIAGGIRPAAALLSRLQVPLPPIAIGMLFAVNWLTYRGVLYLLPAGETLQFYDTAGEAMECISSLIFLMISVWFWRVGADISRAPRALAHGASSGGPSMMRAN